jgi:DNA-directed RNA polymerase specialized sigma24 family protein
MPGASDGRTAHTSSGSRPVSCGACSSITPEPPVDVVALDCALEALAAVDVRKSRMVELRFFGGLSVEETAQVLHVSADTIKRDWRLAKLWLLRELDGDTH